MGTRPAMHKDEVSKAVDQDAAEAHFASL